MAWPLRCLRRVEHPHRGGPGTARGPGPAAKVAGGRRVDFVGSGRQRRPAAALPTGIAELDRVLGGGIVPASAVLVGGDPGIGKSTLLLQAAAALAARRPPRALHLRRGGDRTGAPARPAAWPRTRRRWRWPRRQRCATSSRAWSTASDAALVVIDSIQTMWLDALDSAPGTVAQVRACAAELIRLPRRGRFAMVLVGHVTKEGSIAGPRVLEHMVDAVLYFEGDRGHQFRILRAVKNRFGATDEIGVFEMTERGLAEVANPSALFLAERRGNIAGSAVFAGHRRHAAGAGGSAGAARPTRRGTPRRQVVGWDSGRLSDAAGGAGSALRPALGIDDVYLNIAGGLRIGEPAADLAVAAALVSAATDLPTDPGMVYFGEVGLSGEVRQVAQAESRLREAQKLGFAGALPRRVARGGRPPAPDGLR